MRLINRKKAEPQLSRYEERLRRKKQKEEEKQFDEKLKETKKRVKIELLKRRELGKKITFAPMEDLIPVKKAINRGIEGFELINDLGFFNIVKVVSFDYRSMDDDNLDSNIYYWAIYYRTTGTPLKRISVNMPVDTTPQVNNYKQKLERTSNPLYEEKIKDYIDELTTEFEDRETKDYYMIYYADNLDSLLNETAHIEAALEEKGITVKISPLSKLEVINKFSNPYSFKKMIKENFIVAEY